VANQLQTTSNFGIQNWTTTYASQVAPFLASYDFETIRKSMIDYIKANNPENFNDIITSSEFVTLIDLIAFMGQSLSYRFDLNARESFLGTATTRNSINYLANLINYIPSRNLAANGYLKINSISVNDNINDSLGNNLINQTINWNDNSNRNWLDQWNSIINAVLINSQSVGSPGNTQLINGINYSEYSVGSPSGQGTPFPFSATINNSSMNFEIVNPTSIGQSYIYELDPYNSNNIFNLLFENDGLGYSSFNTGYFLYFKQGSLSSQSFSFSSALPNVTYTLNATGVNNTDVWLYRINSDGTYTQWTQVPAIYGENTTFNNLPSTTQTIFSLANGANDSITLVFGDGVFGAIPVGNFICYTRSSNGQTYRINPSELSNVTISIPYTSKNNRTQILKVRASLQYTVGNSAAAESLANIKLKAPQSFYSQNRMVNGQDYNSFPFSQYSNILQIKAVNRTSSGVSRYLDVIDPTGKYSSTNIFCDDGFLYLNDNIVTNTYSYSNLNNLANIIDTQISVIVASSPMLAFVLNTNNYAPTILPKVSLGTGITNYNGAVGPNIQWNLVLNNATSSSGWFGDISLNASSNNILVNISSISNILVPGAVIKFIAPPGYVFDSNNNIVYNNTGILNINQKTSIYTTIVSAVNDGYGNDVSSDGQNIDGTGAILLNQYVPYGALLSTIYPYFIPTIPSTIITKLLSYLASGTAVAIQYNASLAGVSGGSLVWGISTLPAGYSPTTYGTAFLQPATIPTPPTTSSWLLAFVPTPTNPNNFTVYQRSNAYFFGSERQTTFYYDANAKVYDPVNSTILNDRITILNTNAAPGQNVNTGLSNDIPIEISGTVNEINGTLDNSRVTVQYADLTSSGVPSNPTFFSDCVASGSYIFLVTNNSTSTTKLIASGGVIIVDKPSTINNNLYYYSNNSIIFCLSNLTFYQISRFGTVATKKTLNNPGDTLTYSYYAGRQNLKFQYQHNAADSRRIDPSPANIIDIYCLEASYAAAYQAWATDLTGQLSEPTPPTTETLSNDFSALNNFKMISDELIFNSAQFVPLFGDKAALNLQATFVVVPNTNMNVSSGEIASQVITYINTYFSIGNFSFGQTFYWSNLNNYLLSNLGNMISSISLVPSAGNLQYGALEQIFCNPYEIFMNVATVKNVSVVSATNKLNLRIS
jgi:hypothetical protein